jgi:hypothetical protein
MTPPLLDLIERTQANDAHIQLQHKLPAELIQAGWELFHQQQPPGLRYHAIQYTHRLVTEEHITLDDCLAEIYAYCYLLELLPVPALLRIEAQFPATPMLPSSFKHLIRKLERISHHATDLAHRSTG